MALEVIGAGFGRTGTLSTKAALEVLGYRPCYHFVEVIDARPGYNDGHREAWVEFMRGDREMDWAWLYRAYRATLDLPMCLYYRELMEVFPKAKVLLTVRDPDSWFDSFSRMTRMIRMLRAGALVSPKLRATAFVGKVVNDRLFGGTPKDRKAAVAAFERHNEEVTQTVPADRLLVFDVRQGWEPLCEFLDQAVPSFPFPRLNDGEALSWRMIQALILQRKKVFSTDRYGDEAG